MRAILLVDDEVFVLKAVKMVVSRRRPDWHVVAVGSAKDALAELARAAYDVVVSDMRMPGMDGAELLACVRDVQPAARRLILTGHAERAVMDRAFEVAHVVLEKPCGAKELLECIERELATFGN